MVLALSCCLPGDGDAPLQNPLCPWNGGCLAASHTCLLAEISGQDKTKTFEYKCKYYASTQAVFTALTDPRDVMVRFIFCVPTLPLPRT